MKQLTVIVPLLNVRRRIPNVFPDPEGIIGVVQNGFSFQGEEVPHVENPAMGTWYADNNGQYYWGGGLAVDEHAVTQFEVSAKPWWISKYGIDRIWEKTKGENVKVAVLDSGYNTNNADLAGAVVDSGVFMKSISGNPISIQDKLGHGTHCASLIGNRNINNIIGMAPAVDLYIAKITSLGSVSSHDNISNAIEWAIQHQVDIISISYGGESPDSKLEQMINTAVERNIAVFSSIGNRVENGANKPHYPALYPNCIAVGAVDMNDKLSTITIIDPKTEINAPGDAIMSYKLTTNLEPETGTSQATAIVAGICALLISRFKALNKPYNVNALKQLITSKGSLIHGGNGQKIINPIEMFNTI